MIPFQPSMSTPGALKSIHYASVVPLAHDIFSRMQPPVGSSTHDTREHQLVTYQPNFRRLYSAVFIFGSVAGDRRLRLHLSSFKNNSRKKYNTIIRRGNPLLIAPVERMNRQFKERWPGLAVTDKFKGELMLLEEDDKNVSVIALRDWKICPFSPQLIARLIK